mgnify:CR=1 FL=1
MLVEIAEIFGMLALVVGIAITIVVLENTNSQE